MRTPYRAEIEAAAKAHGLEPDLVEAVVMTESSGHTDAFRWEPNFYAKYLAGKPQWADWAPRRVASSYGLMQVMYVVARELGFTGEPELLFVPRVGLDWGCRKLATLLAWSGGNVLQALAAYNGGKGGNATPPYRNAHYAAKVLAARSAIVTLEGKVHRA